MKDIVKFLRDKYKILIPVMVGVVLLITMFFLYREYQYDNKRNKNNESVFQYFAGIRTDYTAEITYNLRDAIVDLRAVDAKIEYDSTPIYYSNLEKTVQSTVIDYAADNRKVLPNNVGSVTTIEKADLNIENNKANGIGKVDKSDDREL